MLLPDPFKSFKGERQNQIKGQGILRDRATPSLINLLQALERAASRKIVGQEAGREGKSRAAGCIGRRASRFET